MSLKISRLTIFRMLGLAMMMVALLAPACGGTPEGACTKNGDCTDLAQECSPTDKKCVDIKCTSDSSCRGGWFCKTDTQKCQKDPVAECQADADCNNDQKCESGKCVAKPECEANSDCGSLQECSSNKCVAKTCQEDLDCGDNTKYECKEGTCAERTIECQLDADCKDAAKPVCKDNKCIAKEGCETKADCTDPAKPLCVARECVADTGAAEGEKCGTGTNCKSGLVCGTFEANSTDGVCAKPCDPYSPNCEGSKICRLISDTSGACVDPNNGKKLGEDCDKDNPCELNLYCVEWKTKRTCAKPCDRTNAACETGEECYEALKDRTVCVSEREPCGPGRPCNDGEICNNGKCDPPPSCDTITCKPEEVCEAGACRAKKCPTEVQCAQGESCDSTSGKCVTQGANPPCVPCATGGGAACQGTAQCISGLGNAGESFCFDDCSQTGTCTDSTNFTCRQITLNQNGVQCTSTAQCGSGFTCDTNTNQCQRQASLCIPIIGTCRNKCNGVTCNAGEKCVPTTGTCITPGKMLCDACTVGDECGGTDDACLSFPNGGSFCGQDCRTKTCPTGYNCYNLSNGGRQCAPADLNKGCPP